MSIEKIWNKAPSSWRHLDKNSTNVKNNIDYITPSLEKISPPTNVVDWGPGGGYISQHIHKRFDTIESVDFVDICDDRFDLVEKVLKNVNSVVGHKYDSESGPSALSIRSCPDLLICYSVIYHMPSIAYAEEVLKYWNDELKPKQILIRSLFVDQKENWERGKQTEDWNHGDILRGNLMTLDHFSGLMKDYDYIEKDAIKNIKHAGCPQHIDMRISMKRTFNDGFQ